jgi:DNA-binding XRE family transcriptional regulator
MRETSFSRAYEALSRDRNAPDSGMTWSQQNTVIERIAEIHAEFARAEIGQLRRQSHSIESFRSDVYRISESLSGLAVEMWERVSAGLLVCLTPSCDGEEPIFAGLALPFAVDLVDLSKDYPAITVFVVRTRTAQRIEPIARAALIQDLKRWNRFDVVDSMQELKRTVEQRRLTGGAADWIAEFGSSEEAAASTITLTADSQDAKAPSESKGAAIATEIRLTQPTAYWYSTACRRYHDREIGIRATVDVLAEKSNHLTWDQRGLVIGAVVNATAEFAGAELAWCAIFQNDEWQNLDTVVQRIHNDVEMRIPESVASLFKRVTASPNLTRESEIAEYVGHSHITQLTRDRIAPIAGGLIRAFQTGRLRRDLSSQQVATVLAELSKADAERDRPDVEPALHGTAAVDDASPAQAGTAPGPAVTARKFVTIEDVPGQTIAVTRTKPSESRGVTVGQLIREARELAALTQEELAQKLSIGARKPCDRVTIVDWEKDRTIPSLKSLRKISGALRIPLEKLVQTAKKSKKAT